MQPLTVVPLLAYTDPNKPYILYTDAYDIACGGALVQTLHCIPAVRRMMNILNRRRYVALFCHRRAAEHLLVKI